MNKYIIIKGIIANLNGYLQSMRRLGLNQCHYSTSVREIKNNFENEIEDYKTIFNDDYQVSSQKHADYKQLEQLHHDLIYSKLKIKGKDTIKLFEWDIVEYFGLASTSIDKERSFHPTVSNGAIVLKLKSKKFKSLVYYFVEIGGFMATVTLSEKREKHV